MVAVAVLLAGGARPRLPGGDRRRPPRRAGQTRRAGWRTPARCGARWRGCTAATRAGAPRAARRRSAAARRRAGARVHRRRALAQHAGRSGAEPARPARAGRARRLLDLHVHQLPAHALPPARLGRPLPRGRPDDRRRPHARVRVRAARGQRARRDGGQRPALPGRARQRLRHLERMVEPLLAGEVPGRRARAGPLLALRRGRVRRDRARDPGAARRGRARAPAPRPPPAPAEQAASGVTTPETYLGFGARARLHDDALFAGARDFGDLRVAPPQPTGSRTAGAGRSRRSARSPARGRASTRTSARAASSSCSARRSASARVRVLLDGRPLPDRLAGADVHGGVARVGAQRLYRLVDFGRGGAAGA